MRMTLRQQRDIIDAAIRGEEIEFCFTGDDNRWSKYNAPMFDFTRYIYRVKPPELRPHWPAIIRLPDGAYILGKFLYTMDDPALINVAGFVRLATEYPPVMLP